MTALLIASHHWEGHDGPWFPLFPLVFVALWIGLFFLIARRWRGSDRRAGEAVLAERYARGDIDEAELVERRKVLRQRA